MTSTYHYRLMQPSDIRATAQVARTTFDSFPLIEKVIDDALADMFSNAKWGPRYTVAVSDAGEIVGFHVYWTCKRCGTNL